jgi:hypothetical protein
VVLYDEVSALTETVTGVQLPLIIAKPYEHVLQVGELLAPLAQAEGVKVAVTAQFPVIAPVV